MPESQALVPVQLKEPADDGLNENNRKAGQGDGGAEIARDDDGDEQPERADAVCPALRIIADLRGALVMLLGIELLECGFVPQRAQIDDQPDHKQDRDAERGSGNQPGPETRPVLVLHSGRKNTAEGQHLYGNQAENAQNQQHILQLQ